MQKKRCKQQKSTPQQNALLEEQAALDKIYLSLKERFNRYFYLVVRNKKDIQELSKQIIEFKKNKVDILIDRYEMASYSDRSNYFALLKVKLSLLYGRSCLQSGNTQDAVNEFAPLVRHLGMFINRFNFQHDYQFKLEIVEFIEVLFATSKLKIVNTIVTEDLSAAFEKKCGPGYFQLKYAYARIKKNILLTGLPSRANKKLSDEYMSIFEHIKKTFDNLKPSQAIIDDSLRYQILFDYLDANILTFLFELTTHVNMRKSTLETAIETRDFKYVHQYIDLFNQLMPRYLTPAIALFQHDVDYKNIRIDTLFLGHFASTYAQIYRLLLSQFYSLLAVNDLLQGDYGNPHKIILEQTITHLYASIINWYEFYKQSTEDSVHIPLDFEGVYHMQELSCSSYDLCDIKLLYQNFILKADEAKKTYDDELEKKALIATKYQEELLLKEEILEIEKNKARYAAFCLKKTQLIHHQVLHQYNESSRCLVRESDVQELQINPINIFMDNGSSLLKKETYEQAGAYYLMAKNEAKRQHDEYSQLLAIDALIDTHALILKGKIETIQLQLNNRLASKQALSREQLLNLESSLYSVHGLYTELTALYSEHNQLSEHCVTPINDNKQERLTPSEGADRIRRILASLKIKIECIEQKNKELIAKKSEEKRQYIMELGRKDLNRSELKKEYTSDELMKRGIVKFVELGEANKKKGQHVSDFTKEALIINQIQSVLGELSHVSAEFSSAAKQDKFSSIQLDFNSFFTDVFISLNEVSQEHFLVGSTVINLLLAHWGQVLISTDDLDFISASVDYNALSAGGFIQSKYKNNLYSRNDFVKKIELFCLDNVQNWLFDSLLSRHFTIGALCCDCDGLVIDPTGLGFKDLSNQCIRMIGDPSLRLEGDPVIALLVIKYELLGFQADDLLYQALLSWKPTASLITDHTTHLNAVLSKLLGQFDEIQCVQRLIDYGLLGKLFNVEQGCDLKQTLFELKRKIKRTMPDLIANPYRLFNVVNDACSEAQDQQSLASIL